jgi:hypothetical protein
MESRIVLFIGVACAALILNTLIAFFAYKAFANVTAKLTESVTEFSANGMTRSWLHSLEIASSQAAAVTTIAKEQVQSLDPLLARAQDMYGYGLAKVDRKFERVCEVVTQQIEDTQAAILKPAEKIGAVASGLEAVLGLAPRI